MFRILCILLLSLFWYLIQTYGAINYEVTPIKYELDMLPGESRTIPASIRNKWDTSVILPITKSDFQASGPGWVPSFVRRSELVFPDQWISTWLTLWESSVSLAPGEKKTIDVTINVPESATPGGHYWAVLFRNPGSESSAWWTVGINVDYGILILINVAWEVIIDVEIEDPIISWWSSWGRANPSFNRSWWNSSSNSSWESSRWSVLESTNNNSSSGTSSSNSTRDSIESIPITTSPEPVDDDSWYLWEENWVPVYELADECPLGDFTPSRYDGRCFWGEPWLFSGKGISPENAITWLWEAELSNNDFQIDFAFPINNKGNTHIKPTGKVILTDEDGKKIKGIWRQVRVNEFGAIVGEEIVDYIPINSENGNVLPKTKRVFTSQWKGFPYKNFDERGNQIVNYLHPSDYYTQQNKQNSGFLMFWERVSEVRQNKTITADIELTYPDVDGKDILFNTAKEFPIRYVEQRVSLNPYIILGLMLLFLAWIMMLWVIRWWLIATKKRYCWSCDEKIQSHWKTCPHCKTLQDKKSHKKFMKQSQKKLSRKKKK